MAGHYLAAHANAARGRRVRRARGPGADRPRRPPPSGPRALGAHDQAVTFLEQALSVATDPAEQADLLERAGEAARTGAHAMTRPSISSDAPWRSGRELGDRLGTARATASLAETLLQGYRDEPALELLEGAAAEFADLAPDPVVATLGVHLAGRT